MNWRWTTCLLLGAVACAPPPSSGCEQGCTPADTDDPPATVELQCPEDRSSDWVGFDFGDVASPRVELQCERNDWVYRAYTWCVGRTADSDRPVKLNVSVRDDAPTLGPDQDHVYNSGGYAIHEGPGVGIQLCYGPPEGTTSATTPQWDRCSYYWTAHVCFTSADEVGYDLSFDAVLELEAGRAFGVITGMPHASGAAY